MTMTIARKPGPARRRAAATAVSTDRALLIAAFAALSIGALIYALARPLGAALLPALLHAPQEAAAALRPLTGSAPTLLHVLGFSLLTVALLSRARAPAACAAWTAINVAFEAAQHPAVARALLDRLPAPAGHDGLAALAHAHLRGTFDWNDLGAAVIGGGLAFAITTLAPHGRIHAHV